MATPESHSAASPHRHKRLRGTPTGHTPHRPPKRIPLHARDQPVVVERRRLSYADEPKKTGPSPWTEEEIKALVEFLSMRTSGHVTKGRSTGKGLEDLFKSDVDLTVLVRSLSLPPSLPTSLPPSLSVCVCVFAWGI